VAIEVLERLRLPVRRSRLTRAERAVRVLIDSQVARVDRLPTDVMRAMAPVFARAQRDLLEDMNRWMVATGDDQRFTPHSYRVALAQINEMQARLQQALGEHLESGATLAASLAPEHLTREIAALSRHFQDSVTPVNLDAARVVATSKSYIIPRIQTSAARYAGMVGHDLRETIAASILRGESRYHLVNRLQRQGGPMGRVDMGGGRMEDIPEGLFRRYRHWAERVARTEVHSAYNSTLMESMHDARRDIPDLQKRWCADGSACDAVCLPINGQKVALDAMFDTPRGAIEHAPAHPNCRCRTGAWRAEWAEFLD